MQARFLHLADVHLGYRQYNSNERANDFARAFLAVIDAALSQRVDFVVLAGDLFHKRGIEALTLNQAMRGLQKLRDAGIPCIAVEGNHENVYFDEVVGWVRFLALNDLLILLNPDIKEGVAQLSPYQKRAGSYIDIKPGLRVHGLKWQGASTAAALERYVAALAELPKAGIDYSIFIAHAGVEEALPEMGGGLSLRQWATLRPHVDYLALGHIHKPYQYDNWIYNPGSTESNSIAEVEWEDRGYLLVEVDTDHPQEGVKHQATQHKNPRRPFFRVHSKVDLLTSPLELYEHCRQLLERKARDVRVDRLGDQQRPVVELMLTGALQFERAALEQTKLEELVNETFQPLLPLIKNNTQSPGATFSQQEGLSRTELEKQVLISLLEQDSRFRPRSEAWASAAITLKRLALSNAGSEALVDELAALMANVENIP